MKIEQKLSQCSMKKVEKFFLKHNSFLSDLNIFIAQTNKYVFVGEIFLLLY
jgi:hypothetical protein